MGSLPAVICAFFTLVFRFSGGVILSRLSQSFLMLLSMLVLTCVLYAVPWTTSKFADVTAYGVIGGTVAILLIRKSTVL